MCLYQRKKFRDTVILNMDSILYKSSGNQAFIMRSLHGTLECKLFS